MGDIQVENTIGETTNPVFGLYLIAFLARLNDSKASVRKETLEGKCKGCLRPIHVVSPTEAGAS